MSESGWALLQRRLLLRYDELKSRLARRLGSTEMAGDVLQDTWLRLERGGNLASVRSPDTYLYRIAVNIAHDHLRAENRRLTMVEVDSLFDLADETPDAARIAEARSELDALKMVMLELPPRQRAILLSARLDGMSRQDIAHHYGISVRLVQRELQEAQDYCAARLKKMAYPRFRSLNQSPSTDQGHAATVGDAPAESPFWKGEREEGK